MDEHDKREEGVSTVLEIAILKTVYMQRWLMYLQYCICMRISM